MQIQDRDAFPDAARQRDRAGLNRNLAASDSGSSEWVPSEMDRPPERRRPSRAGWVRVLAGVLFAIVCGAGLLGLAHFSLRG